MLYKEKEEKIINPGFEREEEYNTNSNEITVIYNEVRYKTTDKKQIQEVKNNIQKIMEKLLKEQTDEGIYLLTLFELKNYTEIAIDVLQKQLGFEKIKGYMKLEEENKSVNK